MVSTDTNTGQTRVPWTVADVARAILAPVVLYAVTFLARRGLAEVASALPDATTLRYATGALVILFQLALLLPVWWWGLRKYRAGWKTLGFRGFAVLPGCGLILTLLVLGYVFTGAWGLFLRQYGLRAQPNPLPLFGEGAPGLLIALLAAGLVAPFTEEVFFRGFVFGALRDRMGVWGGIALSALIFAVAHLQPYALPALFALGALLAWLYQLTGSLWPGIVMHSTINTVALLVLYFVGDSLTP